MDFLFFFLGYIGLFSAAALFVLISPASPLLTRISDRIKTFALKVLFAVVPNVILKSIQTAVHYVFNTRNPVMQLVFGLLVMGGNAILMRDILPLLYVFEPEENHLLLPLVFLFSNAAAFHLSCSVDPGRITAQNVAALASFYKADGSMYQRGAECPTCRLVKPPRSKHCSICNRCVHRFDHHCIWTNNCVGAGNLRFFLPFLLTLLAMVINGAVMGVRAMALYTEHLNILDSKYLDPRTGQALPITIPVLIQHLFMQHPRCVFLVSSLAMLTVLLSLFTLYHLYLVLHNQTTNERYKMAALASSSGGARTAATFTAATGATVSTSGSCGGNGNALGHGESNCSNGKGLANGQVNGKPLSNGKALATGQGNVNGQTLANGQNVSNGKAQANGKTLANGQTVSSGNNASNSKPPANGKAVTNGQGNSRPVPRVSNHQKGQWQARHAEKDGGIKMTSACGTNGMNNNNNDSVNSSHQGQNKMTHSLDDLGRFYNKGVWQNLKEVFLPWSGLGTGTKSAEPKSFAMPRKKMKRQ